MQGPNSLLKASLGCLYLALPAVGELARKPEVMKRRWREGIELFHFLRESCKVAR